MGDSYYTDYEVERLECSSCNARARVAIKDAERVAKEREQGSDPTPTEAYYYLTRHNRG